MRINAADRFTYACLWRGCQIAATCLLILACTGKADAQQLVRNTDSKFTPALLFSRFTSKEGLPDNRIRSIFQDKRGFLWLGTMNGLCRYDGYSFKKYNSGKQGDATGGFVYEICEDERNHLWIGTSEGLSEFDPLSETFTTYKNIPGNVNSLLSNKIKTVEADASGTIWIGTEKGLASFNPATKKFKNYPAYPLSVNICKIIRSAGNFIWVATDKGIVHYNTTAGTFKFYPIDVQADPYGDVFWSMLENDRDLYIGTGREGLIKLNYNESKHDYDGFASLNNPAGGDLSNASVFDICRSRSGELWLGTNRGVARLYKPGTPEARISFYSNNPVISRSLSNNTVYRVFKDRTDVLWCGTEFGLNKLDIHSLPFQYFTFQDAAAQDQVRSIYTQDGKTLWLGTAKNGFYSYDLSNQQTQSFHFSPLHSPYNAYRSMYASDNRVWLGTLGGALSLNNGSSVTKEIDGNAVFAFLKDSKGNLWLGTNFGLYRQAPNGLKTLFRHKIGESGCISADFVRSLYEDHAGRIWVGLENNGLNYFDPRTNKFTALGNSGDSKLLGRIVFSILEYPENTLWAGSELGLNRITLNNSTQGELASHVKKYTERDGLSDKSVNGILADSHGTLWISTIKGLLRFDIKREQFRTYLPGLNFSFSCAYKFNDHQLMFGTTDGFLVFDPARITNNDFTPPVVISGLKLFNREVSIGEELNGDVLLEHGITETPEIKLNHRNNVFTLEFAGLHFSDPEDNRYAYKMEGFDKEWIQTGAAGRSATYTNLDAGTYYFKVKAANSFGRWNDIPATLKVTIVPPPWKTWWAYLCYLALFVAVLLTVLRYLLLLSRQKHELVMEHKMRLKEEDLHREQVSFFTNVTHELQTPLTLISGSIERMRQKNDSKDKSNAQHFMSLIHQQSSRLTYLVNQLLDFRKAEAGYLKNNFEHLDLEGLLNNIATLFLPLCEEKGLDLSVNITSGLQGWCDKDKLEKIVFNLLSNAVKHSSRDEKIIFGAHFDTKEKMELVVTNSGCELTKEQLSRIFDRFFVVDASNSGKFSNGIGLTFTRQLVTVLGGELSVSNTNGWIAFTARLPLNAPATEAMQQPATSTNTPSYLLRSIAANADAANQLTENNKRALMSELDDQLKKTVLVVEDESGIRYLLRDLLEEHYVVYEAEDGRQALELLTKTKPDIIISDIMMPDISGLELCNKVKNSPDTCHIPFVLLSARGSADHKSEGYDAGADAYIPKPFETQYLLKRMRSLLEYRQRLQELFKRQELPGKIGDAEIPDTDKQFLNKLVALIEENIEDTELDAAFLEQQLFMSKMQLYRKLKALSDMAPAEFIKHVRLLRAVQLLQQTQLTVAEIFYRTGFNNQSYFFREFKKRYGCSPNEYRAQNRIHV